jgi:hypothetical protein
MIAYIIIAIITGIILIHVNTTIQNMIYNFWIVPHTSKLYSCLLDKISPKSRVLDVGIGNATSLLKNAFKVKER